jgi:hypothetical protein
VDLPCIEDAQWLSQDFADIGTQVIILPYPMNRYAELSDDDDEDDDDIIANVEDTAISDNKVADNDLESNEVNKVVDATKLDAAKPDKPELNQVEEANIKDPAKA